MQFLSSKAFWGHGGHLSKRQYYHRAMVIRMNGPRVLLFSTDTVDSDSLGISELFRFSEKRAESSLFRRRITSGTYPSGLQQFID